MAAKLPYNQLTDNPWGDYKFTTTRQPKYRGYVTGENGTVAVDLNGNMVQLDAPPSEQEMVERSPAAPMGDFIQRADGSFVTPSRMYQGGGMNEQPKNVFTPQSSPQSSPQIDPQTVLGQQYTAGLAELQKQESLALEDLRKQTGDDSEKFYAARDQLFNKTKAQTAKLDAARDASIQLLQNYDAMTQEGILTPDLAEILKFRAVGVERPLPNKKKTKSPQDIYEVALSDLRTIQTALKQFETQGSKLKKFNSATGRYSDVSDAERTLYDNLRQREAAYTETLNQMQLDSGLLAPEEEQAIKNRGRLLAAGVGQAYDTNQPVAKLDADTAKQILQEAKGDKDLARRIAKQRGYVF